MCSLDHFDPLRFDKVIQFQQSNLFAYSGACRLLEPAAVAQAHKVTDWQRPVKDSLLAY